MQVYLGDKGRFWIQIFVKLIIYESSYKKSKSISKTYFYHLGKLVEWAKIHISCKFKKCMIFVIKFYFYFLFSLKLIYPF
jgi:hypothetical protein